MIYADMVFCFYIVELCSKWNKFKEFACVIMSYSEQNVTQRFDSTLYDVCNCNWALEAWPTNHNIVPHRWPRVTHLTINFKELLNNLYAVQFVQLLNWSQIENEKWKRLHGRGMNSQKYKPYKIRRNSQSNNK